MKAILHQYQSQIMTIQKEKYGSISPIEDYEIPNIWKWLMFMNEKFLMISNAYYPYLIIDKILNKIFSTAFSNEKNYKHGQVGFIPSMTRQVQY
jgi:hypothetical protein